MTRDEQAALVAWLRGPGVVWSAVTEQLEECGSVRKAAAEQVPAQGSLFEAGIFEAGTFEAGTDGLDEAARDLDRWERAGIRMVCVLDAGYPSNLRMIHQHPPVLFMRGSADERDATSVAVVGTRQPTPQGIDQARQLAAGLTANGIPVISGLAAGIDTAALTATLTAGGRAVAVIGTGIDRVYPPQNAGLQEEIAAKGLVISQFLPGSPPTKISFPLRNAVMSGYALATVVVEAAGRSGSRMQARLALQHGRHVFLMRSLLEHEWARDYAERPGVTLVDTADDVFSGLQRLASESTDLIWA
jgi:DNA processing protein